MSDPITSADVMSPVRSAKFESTTEATKARQAAATTGATNVRQMLAPCTTRRKNAATDTEVSICKTSRPSVAVFANYAYTVSGSRPTIVTIASRANDTMLMDIEALDGAKCVL